MARTVSLSGLGNAVAEELSIYHESVVEQVNAAGDKSIKKMVKLAKAGAPSYTGRLKKNITSKAVDAGRNFRTYVLYAKAPSHRIFHLAVHGHATANGGRARGNGFLQSAVDAVLPEYEQAIEEAIRNG